MMRRDVKESRVRLADFRDVCLKIPSNISAEVAGEKNGFLFDSNTGRVYALNKTASFIFSKIKEEMSISDIVKELKVRYDVDEALAISDIQDFLYQLREFNIGSDE